MKLGGPALLFRTLRVGFATLGFWPFVPALVRGVPVVGAVGSALDVWFAFQCERDPARMLAGSSVCARCAGIYLGLGLGALLLRPRLSPFRQRVWLLSAACLLALDVASEVVGLRPAFAPLRFLTGALLGYPASLGVLQRLEARASPRLE